MSSAERSITISAPPEACWAVLAEFGAISSWVPLVGHSCLLSEVTSGPGAVRRVQIARQALVERVVAWNPNERLSYDIEGLPPIVGRARNTWTLTPAPEGGTEVTLTTHIPTGRNPVKRFVAGKVLERMSLASQMMLAGLDTAATARAATSHADTPGSDHSTEQGADA